jgi:hypothetical protein
MSQSGTTPQSTIPPLSDVAPVNASKSQFLTDMELAGMMAVSRKRYLFAVAATDLALLVFPGGPDRPCLHPAIKDRASL